MQHLFNVVVLAAVLFLLVQEFTHAVDRQIDQQSVMLCNAAKVSGNEEYTLRCANFYQTGDIKTLR